MIDGTVWMQTGAPDVTNGIGTSPSLCDGAFVNCAGPGSRIVHSIPETASARAELRRVSKEIKVAAFQRLCSLFCFILKILYVQ